MATNKLEGTTYFQGKRTVDDYLDDLRDLISESGYSDLKTIVVKFQRGLNPMIVDVVATMASGRPDDLDLDAWYEAAIRIDQNQAANDAFRSAHQVKTSTFPHFQQLLLLPNWPNPPTRFAHTQPAWQPSTNGY